MRIGHEENCSVPREVLSLHKKYSASLENVLTSQEKCSTQKKSSLQKYIQTS